MKKSILTPKEISKKRLARSKIMKISLDELYFIDKRNKENEPPQYPIMPKTTFKIHDRTIKGFGIKNPYEIPYHQRIFTKPRDAIKVKPEPFIMSEPHTICDVDQTFYKIIEGRPLRQFDDIKVYMRNIRDITLFKANAAYLEDQIIQMDTIFAFENSEYEAINRLYIKCKDNFVQFAKESYTKAKNIQKLAEEKALQLEAVTDNLESLCFKYVAVRNKLGVIIVNFETLLKYRQFLDSRAPIWWRDKNEQEFDEMHPLIAKGSEYKRNEKFMTSNVAPNLFFTKPRQMSLIFDNLGRQCLSYMQIEVLSSSLVNSVMKSRDYLKEQVMEEIDEMEDLVEAYRGYVEFMEEKEQEFKIKFERVLANEFQVLFSSYEASKLFTCLQYTNTQVFEGPEDPKDSITTLMLHLERYYMELTSALDNLNQVVVKEATNEFFSEDLKMMNRAHLAQRYLKECDILSKALYTSFEPPKCSKKNERRHVESRSKLNISKSKFQS